MNKNDGGPAEPAVAAPASYEETPTRLGPLNPEHPCYAAQRKAAGKPDEWPDDGLWPPKSAVAVSSETPRMDSVICPACAHQFQAISQDHQDELSACRAENAELTRMNAELRQCVDEHAASIFGQENERLKAEIAELKRPCEDVPQSISDFESFINEPSQYEEKYMVREYRHQVYPKFTCVLADFRKLAAQLRAAKEKLAQHLKAFEDDVETLDSICRLGKDGAPDITWREVISGYDRAEVAERGRDQFKAERDAAFMNSTQAREECDQLKIMLAASIAKIQELEKAK